MSHSTESFRGRIVHLSIIVFSLFAFPGLGGHLAAQIVEEALPISSDHTRTQQMDDGRIYWIDKQTVSFTDDNGTTITPLPLPSDAGGYMRMDWTASGKGLLYYGSTLDTGLIALAWTDDNGQSWDVQRFKTLDRMKVPLVRRSFDAIERITDSTVYCAIEKTIFRSTDRGRTFSELEFPIPVQVKNMTFVGPYGWVWPDYSADIAGTTDGGQTWTKHTLPHSLQRLSISRSGRTIIECSMNTPVVFLTKAFQTSLEIPPLPQGEGLGALSKFHYVYIDDDHTWLFTKYHDSANPFVHITSDGGGHWFRTALSTDISHALPIDTSHALILWPVGKRLTLTQDRPFTVSAVSVCTMEKLRVSLTWTDPSDGAFTHGVIERASADSQWTSVGSVLAPDLYFTDETLQDTNTVRYRVTLTTPNGSMQQVSESVTPVPGEYVNFLEMILPGEDWILRYEYQNKVTRQHQPELDTTFMMEYRFLGAYDSTRWIRVFPFQVKETARSGESRQRRESLLLFDGPVRHFTQSEGGHTTVFDLSAPLDFSPPDSISVLGSFGPTHKVYMPVRILSALDADSVNYSTDHPRPLGYHNYLNTAKRGIGVIGRSGGLVASDVRSSESWTLIEHVNSSPQARPSASGLRLSSYPNPFVGAATVTFVVAAAGPVRLSIHDMLGREVALLREGRVEPGSYSVPFSASGLPSGLYIARIQAGHEVAQRLLTCVR